MKFIVALSSIALMSVSSVSPCLAANQAIGQESDRSLSSQSLPSASQTIQVAGWGDTLFKAFRSIGLNLISNFISDSLKSPSRSTAPVPSERIDFAGATVKMCGNGEKIKVVSETEPNLQLKVAYSAVAINGKTTYCAVKRFVGSIAYQNTQKTLRNYSIYYNKNADSPNAKTSIVSAKDKNGLYTTIIIAYAKKSDVWWFEASGSSDGDNAAVLKELVKVR